MSLYLPLLFVLGTILGSFLNVVIWRYKPGDFVFDLKRLRGKSHCPYCKETLRWFELVPLFSFLIQKGKCRRCEHKLSWQYPFVELIAGAVFVAVPWYLYRFYSIAYISLDPRLFCALVVFWLLVFLIWLLISVIDIRHYLVPDELNVTLASLGFFIVVMKQSIVGAILPFHNSFLKHYTLLLSPSQNIWVNHLVGALVGSLFFAFLILVSRGKAMGWGDVKLAFAIGLIIGWPEMGLSLLLAFALGGLIATMLLIFGKKTMGDRLPFAPLLIGSSVLTVFFGASIVQWYLGLFGI